MDELKIKLTAYSHGAGCGCKIAPAILNEILSGSYAQRDNRLLVGNDARDDAAVYDIGDGQCLISTTDFFMPIVDDAYDFGRIAAANAISDVYAMGGKPILAIAILGWPIDKIPASIAREVINGARAICENAGIQLAGGHSIDSPEPIFGLAVNGLVNKENIKKNNSAVDGDLLYLTKPIGVGILTTAEKKGKLLESDNGKASQQMVKLNKIGEKLANVSSVNAMTDVTGFGLLGHALEMVQNNNTEAEIYSGQIKIISDRIPFYCKEGCVPGGSKRNWASYGSMVNIDRSLDVSYIQNLLSDPQTSGGLLISVSPLGIEELEQTFRENGLENHCQPIGVIKSSTCGKITVLP